jgi:hypothetical protein
MSSTDVVGRRGFLKVTGVLTGYLAAGSPLALLAPSRAWALDLMALTSEQGAALLTMARTILPHDGLENAAYAAVVHSADADAARDAAARKSYSDGIASLGGGFASASEEQRVAALKKIEPSAFFQQFRVKALSVLYSTPFAYAHFGYEGEAFSKGGYLTRGFNDLRWLPEVPLSDAGPMPGTAS